MLISALPAARAYWRLRSSNPVRRGVDRATELGCFHCHGPGGRQGVPDPSGADVPSWSGGMFMMYVESAEEVRQFIRDGISARRAASESARRERERAAIAMPAFAPVLRGSDLDDLTAAFLVLSGMRRPPESSAAARGLEVARRQQCFSCHGVAGSGGLPNPGSFTGFVPGWYGADFRDLVRSREEFEQWLTRGRLERTSTHPLAGHFVRRQRLQMPSYPGLTASERDDLWAYREWLEATEGGWRD